MQCGRSRSALDWTVPKFLFGVRLHLDPVLQWKPVVLEMSYAFPVNMNGIGSRHQTLEVFVLDGSLERCCVRDPVADFNGSEHGRMDDFLQPYGIPDGTNQDLALIFVRAFREVGQIGGS